MSVCVSIACVYVLGAVWRVVLCVLGVLSSFLSSVEVCVCEEVPDSKGTEMSYSSWDLSGDPLDCGDQGI